MWIHNPFFLAIRQVKNKLLGNGLFLILLFREGLTQKEIADKIQCSHTRINTIVRTSMKELTQGNRHMLFTHGYTYCCENRILGPWLVSITKEIQPSVFYDLPIYDLKLNIRNKNNLARGNIYTVRDLILKKEDELLKIRGMGLKGVIEIKNRLAEIGLSLS